VTEHAAISATLWAARRREPTYQPPQAPDAILDKIEHEGG
jgi:hypothetical protein